jgi:hypothetical protein
VIVARTYISELSKPNRTPDYTSAGFGSLIDNSALLADVPESVKDRVPRAVRSPHLRAFGGRFPRISTVFESRPVLGEVVRRFES